MRLPTPEPPAAGVATYPAASWPTCRQSWTMVPVQSHARHQQ
jgi:hypothetical protein